MKKWLIKKGYHGEVFTYATIRLCGIWFAYIGCIILAAAVTGGEVCMNPGIFLAGYVIGFYICYGNKKILFERMQNGTRPEFQKNMSDFAMTLLGVLCGVVGLIVWMAHLRSRNIWLLFFLVIAIHFMAFYFVHGRLALILGILCALYATVGLIFTQIPFLAIASADAVSKIVIGILMITAKNPGNEKAFYRKYFTENSSGI